MTRPAFTLVEVVVVLALMGILAAVTAPAFVAPRAESEPLAIATEVRRVLERARSTALARGATVTVTIEPRTARYRVDIDTADERELVVDSTIAIAPGAAIAATAPRLRLRIEPTGAVWGDSVVITSNDRAAIVSADRWSGEIRVREP
jgi:prepilin-type N-terminal cleavage/methylation domain-containing protein